MERMARNPGPRSRISPRRATAKNAGLQPASVTRACCRLARRACA